MDGIERSLQGLDLRFHGAPAVVEHVPPLRKRLVAFKAPVDELANVPDRHSRGFQAFDQPQPLKIRFLEHARPACAAVHKGQKPLLVVIAQCRREQVHARSRFADGVKHGKPPEDLAQFI